MSEELNTEVTEVDYLKYKKSGIKVADLDALKDTVLGVSTGNWFKMIIAGIKIIVIFAYWYVRRKMIKEEILIARNKQLQGQVNDDRDQVDVDVPEV